ncbi:BadF/BadG/BcrA/BcrD ATPase family protein [Paenibacillus filicis]|uniref:BadF/BadG/BcrA/BcrD ATPase family protein n=1 Tax=Paenibacillus filicis TaxID=669464 RepID=A0ABU9DGR8_9BACL
MDDSNHIVIGIDGGGTYTRVMICNLSGNVLAYVEGGPASIYKDKQASKNVQGAISEALLAAGRNVQHVRGVAAGIAGYDTPSDLPWVEELTDVDGLTCPKWNFNDAVAAHRGALLAKPGIVAISGTGSILVAITETGQLLRNYDFHHYSASAARFIAYDAIYEILAGNMDHTDEEVRQQMLGHWGVSSFERFAELARSGFTEDKQERNRIFGEFAPAITKAALQGSSVARRVCDRAIDQIKVGIELLGLSFSEDTVSVACIGSVINSDYIYSKLTEKLAHGNHKRYTLVKPVLSPAAGAVLFALNSLGFPLQDDLIRNLQKSSFSQV